MAKNCSIDMTLCPECVQYVRHCLGQDSVDCPFCEAAFSPSELANTAPTAAAIPRGLKQGVMAASFVGATMLGSASIVACGQAEYGAPIPDNQEPGFNHVSEDVGTDDAGDTGDEDASDDDDTYMHVQPEYGVTMMDAGE